VAAAVSPWMVVVQAVAVVPRRAGALRAAQAPAAPVAQAGWSRVAEAVAVPRPVAAVALRAPWAVAAKPAVEPMRPAAA
jgi:hypothetical protein